MFKERPDRKLMYKLKKVISTNIVKLRLLTSIKIYLVVNISQIVRYKELVEGQKVEKTEPIEIEGVEELKVEKILNKRKIREVIKYLVYWKGFTTEHDTWEKEEDLENIKEEIVEFEKRMSVKVRR